VSGEDRARRGGPGGINVGQLTWGLVIALAGVLLLLDRTGYLEFSLVVRRYWPVLLIAIAMKNLLQPAEDGSRHGFGLLAVGIWLLLGQTGTMAYRRSWPILVIGAGLSILMEGLTKRRTSRREER
jgi:hypothetical protein